MLLDIEITYNNGTKSRFVGVKDFKVTESVQPVGSTPTTIIPLTVIRVCCEATGVKLSDVTQKIRTRKIVRVRQMSYYHIKRIWPTMPLKEIAKVFTPLKQDHSTVIHGIQVWQDEIDTYANSRDLNQNIINAIGI